MQGVRVSVAVAICCACTAAAPPPAGASTLRPSSKVSTAGLGPVKIGMTVRRAQRAGHVDLVSQGPGLGDCRYVRPRNRRIRASFMVIKGRIARVDVAQRGIETLTGFTVGASARAVRAAFGDRLRVTRHAYVPDGAYLEYVPRDRLDAGRRVIFETDGSRVTSIRAGRLPEVRYIEGCA